MKARWGQKEVKMSANTLAYNYSTQKGRRTTGQGKWESGKVKKCGGGGCGKNARRTKLLGNFTA